MSILGRADLLRVWVEGDKRALEQAAERLGYSKAESLTRPTPVVRPRERIEALPKPMPVISAPAPFLRVVRVAYHRGPEGKAPSLTRPRLDPLSDDELRGRTGPQVGKFAPDVPLYKSWRDWAGPLHHALTGADSAGRVDLDALVGRLARLRPIDPLPRAASPGLEGKLWLLLDRSLRARPFWAEQQALCIGLMRAYGVAAVNLAPLKHGAGDPHAEAVASLIAEGDVVVLAAEFEGANLRAWATRGTEFRAAGAATFSVSMLGTEAPAPWMMVGPSSRYGRFDHEHDLDGLLVALSYTSGFEPGHLRELCAQKQLGVPAAWALWTDPRVTVGGDGRASIQPGLLHNVRPKFQALTADEQVSIFELQARWREHTEPELWAGEYLAIYGDGLHEHVATEAREAAETFLRRLDETQGAEESDSEDLTSWVWRVKGQVNEAAFGHTGEFGEALQRLWWAARQGHEVDAVPPGLDMAVATAGKSKLDPTQYALHAVAGGLELDSEAGSLLGPLQASRSEMTIRSLKPDWASSAGFDEYGRWAEFEVKGAVQRLRWIEPGTFLMGSTEEEEGRFEREGPQHEVTLIEGYWLAETACTQELWAAVMAGNPSHFKGKTNPVESVAFTQVEAFIEAINAQVSGLELKLPSEAEWEYACRAGSENPSYGDLNAVAWFDGNSASKTHPVKRKLANRWGLYDMLGNVEEWCVDGADDYECDTYLEAAVSDPSAPAGERPFRVVRGGSWIDLARLVRAAYRDALRREIRFHGLGFRVARGRAPEGIVQPAEPALAPEAGTRGTSPTEAKGAATLALRPGTHLPVDLRAPVRLQTDLMTLDLDAMVRPEWAHGLGRDHFGLYADVELRPKQKSVLPPSFRLRWIPPGRFLMGSPEGEVGGYGDERPQHWVTVTQGYWLADAPCTQQVWEAVLGKKANRSEFRSPDRPVENVSFDDLGAFFEALAKQVPQVRLPTEAEWEYACRAGTTTATYVGDLVDEDRDPRLDAVAWYAANSDRGFELANGQDTYLEVKNAGTHPVRQLAPNPWGLHDMLGNVREWCRDGAKGWAEPDSYAESPVSDPCVAGGERPSRVVRGGSWLALAWSVRAAYRLAYLREDRNRNLGFRVARGRAVPPAELAPGETSPAGKKRGAPRPGVVEPDRGKAGA